MSQKFALIIANSEYSDPGLSQLSAPVRDAENFARVLQSPNICAFDDVITLLNQPVSIVSEAIDEFFEQKKIDDLLVLYFSGHGIRDERGALYLAVRNTNRYRLPSTAIKSDFIREVMDNSRSRRQALILDCCNSGAFAQGTKAVTGGSIGTASLFEGTGYGRIVLTASDSTQFAWEGDQIIGETENSLFTHFLVKGLEGAADDDGDGRITIDELYDYAYGQIVHITSKQTPGKWSYKQQGEIILRQSDRVEDIKPIPLPADLIAATENTIPFVREGAVKQLESLLKGRNIGLARSAKEVLERIANEDDSRRIALLAAQALASFGQNGNSTDEDMKAKEEADRLAAQKVEEERLAKAKHAALSKAAREKAEIESQEKLARENKEREAERKRAEQAAAEKAEREKIEREAKDRLARETAEKVIRATKVQPTVKNVIKPEPKKQSGTKFPLWGIGVIAFVVLALIVWGLSSPPASPAATPTPTVTQTVFVEPATKTPVPATSMAIIVPTSILAIGSTMIGKDNATLVYVPEGEFTMGSDISSDEQPIHKVTLDAFWIDQTEVTNAAYAKCVNAGICQPPNDVNHFSNSNYANHPVVYVDWNKANAYCSWAERRLPTEAEWEKAARGTDVRTYPWGNDAPNMDLLNYNSNIGDTTEVGKYPSGKSIYGAYDMAGNVWEWVNDWYQSGYYATLGDSASNPQGPSSGDGRVLRGGSWFNVVGNVRSAYRNYFVPSDSLFDFGFRCARSLP